MEATLARHHSLPATDRDDSKESGTWLHQVKTDMKSK